MSSSSMGSGGQMMYKNLVDPLAALPTSHTKKYLPRQQTWASGIGGSIGPTAYLQGRGKTLVNQQNQTFSAPASPRLLNHGSGKPEEKKLSPFDKFRNMENKNSSQDYIAPGRLTRQASLPSVSAPRSAPPPTDVNQNQTETAAGPKKSIMSRSPSSAKELLLMWAQQRTNTYPNLNVTNFSTSWNDGLAFCALIHYYYPEAFDFEKLDPKNRRENFTLAFKMAEDYAGICPLLDVEDMVMMIKPDWKCVFTYVQSFYRRFRNGRDPPPPTRILSLQPEESQVSKNQEKVLSPEKQKSLLSKYLLDDDDKDRDRDKKKASSSSLRSTQSRAPLTSTLSSPAVSAGSLEKNITGIKSANLESSLLSKIDEKDETKQAVEKKLASISFADTNQSSSSETSSETDNMSTTSLSTTNTAGDGSNIKTNAECDQNDNLSSPDCLDKDNNNVSSVPVTPPPSANQDLSKPQMPSQPPPNLPAAS